MTLCTVTALVADDEPLLRQALIRKLAAHWPELKVVAEARNGREAIELFELHQPDICFLDIQMPGITGIEAAQEIGRRAHLIFITAYDQYAVKAFQQGALDYLVKPVENERLADTVSRLQERLQMEKPISNTQISLEQLAEQLSKPHVKSHLRWIKASVGNTLRLISVDDIHYLRSDEKYTLIAWSERGEKISEVLIRTPLKDLIDQLDPQLFTQVHRSVVVNLNAIQHVIRDGDTAQIHLKSCKEVLPVSRRYIHLFKQM
ncbi:LytR/AlgR family response regulator transcription factor [Microbulbifer sp. CnH-101-G]|uniref:LytR/AlgR family response regulator transcription factor n=1 Tax=Microbulbifer sp. CnH-101-G TaxID=3243393 RepID=UPI00403A5381